MKTLYRLFILALICASIYSCQQSSGITGNVTGAENMTIYFDQIGIDNTMETLGQTTTDPSGSFNMEMPQGLAKGIYRLRIGARSIDLLLDGSESSLNISGDLKELGRYGYTVDGSSLTNEFLKPMKRLVAKEITATEIAEIVKNEAAPLAAMHLAMKVFQARTNYLDVHKAVLERVNGSDLLGSPAATAYGSIVSQLDGQKRREDAMNKIKVGQPAPEIALADPNGKVIKLSDLKGQLVLIDFWASWCGPCRKANPHVVEMYDKYNKDGFTVYSVSLDGLDTRGKQRYNGDESKIKIQIDRSKEKWLAAIEKDQLKWNNHVSDLRKWESIAAAEYGVRSIPQTFLVGKDGLIAAVNPRYNLEDAIKEHI